ncbi:MAG TPA: sigma factor [Thermoanaerobaculia bacterium]|nr:sigma factor [Thermoanaerobaculia bacterium]
MELDDEVTLLRRVAGKDRRAFTAFYQRYYGRLFTYLLRLTRRADRVEELLQETLLAAWREAPAADERSRPALWILEIAYRKALPRLSAPLPPPPGEEDLEGAGTAPSPHPVQLERLLERIEAAEREEPPPEPWRERLRAWGRSLARLAALFARTPVVLRGMLLVQLAVLLLLAAAFAALRSVPEPGPQEPARARVRVEFFPGVTEGEIRTALLDAGARFVDGPSPQGGYVLELSTPPESAEPALRRLRNWAEVHWLEPIPPPAP